mgnify:FL=1
MQCESEEARSLEARLNEWLNRSKYVTYRYIYVATGRVLVCVAGAPGYDHKHMPIMAGGVLHNCK